MRSSYSSPYSVIFNRFLFKKIQLLVPPVFIKIRRIGRSRVQTTVRQLFGIKSDPIGSFVVINNVGKLLVYEATDVGRHIADTVAIITEIDMDWVLVRVGSYFLLSAL